MFKKGDAVQQIVPDPIRGTVADFTVDRETGAVQVLVEWTDAEGNVSSRYFNADQLQAA
jgi:hypothetical protein